MNYKVPKKFIHQFLEVGGRNYSKNDNGGHIETMAFLLGYEKDELNIIATTVSLKCS